MKKFLVLVMTAVAVASLLPSASLAGGKGKKQVEQGRVPLPAPFTSDEGCFAGAHRRFAIMTQEASKQGPIGYHFDVDPATWNKNFVLEATGGQGSVDMDIYFYEKFGTPEDVVGDPAAAGSPYTVSYNTREEGGEVGKVPPTMTRVIVCMMAGGADATFTYTAGKGVKAPKK